MEGSPPDRELVQAWLGGDASSLERLVRRYLRPGLAVAWEFCEAKEDAEDLLQEAFVRAIGALPDFDPNRAFPPWFFTILRNLGRNAAATRGRWGEVPLEGDLPASEAAADSEVEKLVFSEEVAAAASALPPMQRTCFRLCDLEGFAAGEVSEMLGIGVPTVRVHLHRARRRLREALGPLRRRGAL